VVCCPSYKRGDSKFVLRGKSGDFRNNARGQPPESDVLPTPAGEVPKRFGISGITHGAVFFACHPDRETPHSGRSLTSRWTSNSDREIVRDDVCRGVADCVLELNITAGRKVLKVVIQRAKKRVDRVSQACSECHILPTYPDPTGIYSLNSAEIAKAGKDECPAGAAREFRLSHREGLKSAPPGRC
jgi:hypothetical protein